MSDQNADSTAAHNWTALAIDDESGLADLYANWLEGNYAVHTAYSGSEALEILSQNIDVVLLDRRMPGMSGDEVLTEIRRRDLPCRVAMVTANEPDFAVIEMEFDDYITKPASEDQLRKIADSLLARRQYGERIQELFSLMSNRQVLEAEQSGTALANHDEYTILINKIDDIQSSLGESVHSLDEEGFRASVLPLESAKIDRNSPEKDQQNQTDRGSTFENLE